MCGTSLFACAAAVALFASSAHAAIVWGVDNFGSTHGGTVGDRIVRFNTNSPSGIQVIGDTGVASVQMSGLEFLPNGDLLTVGQNIGTTGASLYMINKLTGAATVIGVTGTAAGVIMTDLAYHPTTGRLLALALQGAAPTVRVYSINVNTGNATLLGAVSGIPSGSADLGLSCDSTGKVYIQDNSTDQMYTLTGTAATAMSSPIGVDCAFSQGMTMDWSVDDSWYLARFGPTNSPYTSDVRVMNNTTGATSSVLTTWPANGTSGLPEYELGDIAIRPTPEPASAAFLLVAGLGLATRRRPSR